MNKYVYSKPSIEQVATFKESTRGVWFGRWKDVFGGKAFIAVGW
ncbi:hypothetical protein A5819_003095 [Enterococcus sp. 7E2_DIV0204]|nr:MULTISPECIES: putative RiPP precursor [unclassified Enterococcus]OTN90595.1 hypothetical protein A5819_003095 [Enterococcus sp. 7E2_DIV0204]OTP53052.1 hypothetical protein A5884_002255 [Enterococcus sp. 7D2_DIV0200]